MDAPPLDPDDWSDEQWQEHLRAAEGADQGSSEDGDGGAEGYRRLRSSAGGTVLGAAMFGLEQAMYGERPNDEVVAEADSDDPGRDGSHFDPDDPSSARLALVVEPSEEVREAAPGRSDDGPGAPRR